ncbi:hypothetical protein BH11PLA1_BH11PLA1_23290 [soil metagenome]
MSAPQYPTPNPEPGTPGVPAPVSVDAARDARDFLISRVIDHAATAEDFAALGALMRGDPSISGELAEAQRIHRLLARAGAEAAARLAPYPAAFGALEAAEAEGVHAPLAFTPAPTAFSTRGKRWGMLGWGIAACLALALTGQTLNSKFAGPQAPGASAGFVAATYATPDDAMKAYIEMGKASGRVVGEMPQRVVIKSQPAPLDEHGQSAGTEVLYVRQLIERAVVTDLYRLGTDELGRTILVPTQPPSTERATSPF